MSIKLVKYRDKYAEMHGQQYDKYTEMHGQQNDKYTEMHGQQNDKYTEMHGQQNEKKISLSFTEMLCACLLLRYSKEGGANRTCLWTSVFSSSRWT